MGAESTSRSPRARRGAPARALDAVERVPGTGRSERERGGGDRRGGDLRSTAGARAAAMGESYPLAVLVEIFFEKKIRDQGGGLLFKHGVAGGAPSTLPSDTPPPSWRSGWVSRRKIRNSLWESG